MRLAIDVSITSQLSVGDPALLIIEAADCDGQQVLASSLTVDNADLRRAEGVGVWARVPDQHFNLRYTAEVAVTRQATPLDTLPATPLTDLPPNVLPYLRPSRFCQSDLFTNFATEQFGALQGGAKIAAIRDWVAATVTYTPGSSHAATTAVETFADHQGVCRDFAHLVCTLARAAQIPARYASAYGPDVTPQDFHAVAQVWLGGAWHIVDATDMGKADGLAVIATGRDAADVAYMETAQWAELLSQSVDVTKA